MHPDHAPGFASSRASLASEAWGAGGILEREFRFLEDFVTTDVGQRNFGCGREEGYSLIKAVHVILELRKLTRSLHALPADKHGRGDLGVTMGTCLEIEQEIDQSPFETRTSSGIKDVAAAADLGCTLQVEKTKSLPDRHVILGIHRSGFAPMLDRHVGISIMTFR